MFFVSFAEYAYNYPDFLYDNYKKTYVRAQNVSNTKRGKASL